MNFDVTAAWRETLHRQHPERAQRMIQAHQVRVENGDITQDLIEVILLDPLKEPATTREEWARIKAEAIVRMLKGD